MLDADLFELDSIDDVALAGPAIAEEPCCDCACGCDATVEAPGGACDACWQGDHAARGSPAGSVVLASRAAGTTEIGLHAEPAGSTRRASNR